MLFVGNFLSGSGTHRHYCEDLSERLEQRDWSITRTSSEPGRVRRLLEMLRVTWNTRSRYEVAHLDVFSGPAFIWAEAVAFELRRLGKPVVLTLRGGRLPAFSTRWPKRVARLLRSAAVVVAPSAYLRDEVQSLAPNIEIVPNAIDVSRYSGVVRTDLRRLVWVRAFHSIYNPMLAVDVLARLRGSHPNLHLTMVGADKDGSMEKTRRRARELGVERALTIVPGVPKGEVPKYLSDGDIFLNTADIDNMPVSVVEAMASGLCIVSTNVGGMSHLIEDGDDGLLVSPRDPIAMSGAVARILGHRDLAENLSRRARARAEAFDWSGILDQWEQLFSRIARAA